MPALLTVLGAISALLLGTWALYVIAVKKGHQKQIVASRIALAVVVGVGGTAILILAMYYLLPTIVEALD